MRSRCHAAQTPSHAWTGRTRRSSPPGVREAAELDDAPNHSKRIPSIPSAAIWTHRVMRQSSTRPFGEGPSITERRLAGVIILRDLEFHHIGLGTSGRASPTRRFPVRLLAQQRFPKPIELGDHLLRGRGDSFARPFSYL